MNGAVDNKLTMNKSKEEAPFDYNYGFSFFFAVLSFLTQELNGICNIYWYVDYYRKYKYDSSEKALRSHTSSVFQIPTIKVNDVITDDSIGAGVGVGSVAVTGATGSVAPVSQQPPANALIARSKISSGSNVRKQSSGSSSGAVSIGFFGKPAATSAASRQTKQFELKIAQPVGKSVMFKKLIYKKYFKYFLLFE